MAKNEPLENDEWEDELLIKQLAELPQDRAPRSLRRKLRKIPRQQRALERAGWMVPRWAALCACLPLVVAPYLYWDNHQKSLEIERGKQDLALVLAYLDKANQTANLQIIAAIHSGLNKPVAEKTKQVLKPLIKPKEYEL